MLAELLLKWPLIRQLRVCGGSLLAQQLDLGKLVASRACFADTLPDQRFLIGNWWTMCRRPR